MKNKELFERANKDNDFELKATLRHAYREWCEVNGKMPFAIESNSVWWDEEVTSVILLNNTDSPKNNR